MSEAEFLDLIFEELDVSSGDSQHPLVLAIGMQIASGRLTCVQARPLLRHTLRSIEQQERGWERAFVN